MLPTALAFVDVETTGGSYHADRVIDIGIVRVCDNKIQQIYSSLINPDTYIPPQIEQLTGITAHHLETAPSFRQVADEVEELLKDCVFVAHNVRFDYGFLKSEFQRLGRPFQRKHFCTAKLSRLLYPAHKRHNLDAVIDRCHLSCPQRHRALPDAQVLWDFYRHIQATFSAELVEQAIQQAVKAPAVPLQIDPAALDALPESAGVYIFYGEDTMPLYVGKSVNIKERVKSHFSQSHSSSVEWKIAQQIQRIETVTTAGELGALLKEAGMIKQMQPVYNRLLRQAHQLVIARRKEDDAGYWRVDLDLSGDLSPAHLSDCVGVFRSKKQAVSFFREAAQEHALCDRLLGIQKTSGACFGHQLARCKGACVGKEPPLSYNARLLSAVQTKMIYPWPFSSAIIITDASVDRSAGYLFDQWCYLGTVQEEDGAMRVDKEPEIRFDLDVYKILKRYLSEPKHQTYIKSLSPAQLSQFTMWEF